MQQRYRLTDELLQLRVMQTRSHKGAKALALFSGIDSTISSGSQISIPLPFALGALLFFFFDFPDILAIFSFNSHFMRCQFQQISSL
ncbi:MULTISPECIES: hypothetical protein [Nostocales]|uniref:Uncharacterized protein n=2 Tax=Nostocales TaxID=1161 RepID=A0A0C1R480_9CYAN|nr:hypothetical protein [Tolypothrix bouteillei]KAF3886530.1 hypothetical protein DA73_0400014350 [Tolypothrix bouteillei VB521301]